MSTGDNDTVLDPATLRRLAEARLPAANTPLNPTETDRLIHELRVHQIELELQNDELRLSRDEAERQRARYTDLYDSAPSGYISLGKDGTMGESNRAAAELLGRDTGMLAGKRLGMFVAVDDRETLNEFLAEVFECSEPVSCELSIVEDAGSARIVSLVGQCTADRTECRVSLTDITLRRRAEAALRMRDRAIAAVSQGMLITDPHAAGHPIIYANAGFEQITGYKAIDVVGRNCRFLQGVGTDREAVRLLREAIAAERPHSVELLNYRKDGTPFWNALSVTPVRDDRGKLVQYIGILKDVSEHREAERALRQAQRMESVGRLAGGIAHDFNNLLTVVNMNSDMLASSLPADGPERELAEAIGRAGERAASLTHQLLAFSRSAAADPEVIDLHRMITGLLEMLRKLAGGRIAVQAVLDPAPIFVRVDPAQMGQILVTLVTQARDALADGGTITVSTSRVTLDAPQRLGAEIMPAGSYAHLTIADTGKGIDGETASRAFEPFGAGVVPGRRNGLGLAMVHGLVKQSHGFISIEPAEPEGSQFVVRLPLHPAPASTASTNRAPV